MGDQWMRVTPYVQPARKLPASARQEQPTALRTETGDQGIGCRGDLVVSQNIPCWDRLRTPSTRPTAQAAKPGPWARF